MGYTHYWRRSYTASDSERFVTFTDKVKLLLHQASIDGIVIASGDGQTAAMWTIDEENVVLNGYKDDSYETFVFTRLCPQLGFGQVNRNAYFDFCKTARRPYDAVVTASLIALKEVYGNDIAISSDGNWDTDWVPGITLYEKTFGFPANNVFSKTDSCISDQNVS